MRLSESNRSLLLGVSIALYGCADTPIEATYFPRGGDGAETLWPKPPEVPRYRYAGELLGEVNFKPGVSADAGSGATFFRWVIGLGEQRGRHRDDLLRPQSGTVGPRGRIYVTDAGRRAVFVFDMEQKRLSVWDRADRGEAFDVPVGIASDANGQLLIADAGLGRVVRLTAEGRPITSFGADVLVRPTGLAWSEEAIYVADSRDHDIKVFDQAGGYLRRIGRRGSGPGEFNGPTHLAVDGDRIYVSDTLNARVQVLAKDGRVLDQIGSRGLYVGNLTRPKGVTVDADGHVYVVESYYDHLVIFDDQARYLLPIGADMGTGGFFLPAGAWSDAQNRIFVADMYNARVVIFQYLGDR